MPLLQLLPATRDNTQNSPTQSHATMSSDAKIIYTLTDEAPFLATQSL
jgi:hypothetical protein